MLIVNHQIMKRIVKVLLILFLVVVCSVSTKACYIGEVSVIICPSGDISSAMVEYEGPCGLLNMNKKQIAQQLAADAAYAAILGCN